MGRSSWEQLKSLILIGFIASIVLVFWSAGQTSSRATASPTTVESPPSANAEGTLIPRSQVENARYYLISSEGDGSYLRTVHVRISSQSKGYSVTRIDCPGQRYQDLGYGEGTMDNISWYDRSVVWVDLVRGSSKSDLVNFVCNQ